MMGLMFFSTMRSSISRISVCGIGREVSEGYADCLLLLDTDLASNVTDETSDDRVLVSLAVKMTN
jgi:hypothetical protein